MGERSNATSVRELYTAFSRSDIETVNGYLADDAAWCAAHGLVVVIPGTEPDPEQLREYWRERLINYEEPESIRIFDELPGLSIGKIDRESLRRLAITADSQHQRCPMTHPRDRI